MSHLALAALLCALTPVAVAAQGAPISHSLDSGTVVRLRWGQGPAEVGKLLAPLEPGGVNVVYCRYPGPPCAGATVARAEARPVQGLTGVEVQPGQRTGRGALLGAVLGAGFLAVGRLTWYDADSPAPWTGQRVAGGLTVVAVAAGIGALIGRSQGRWETVP
jgi:hypothetical protein